MLFVGYFDSVAEIFEVGDDFFVGDAADVFSDCFEELDGKTVSIGFYVLEVHSGHSTLLFSLIEIISS